MDAQKRLTLLPKTRSRLLAHLLTATVATVTVTATLPFLNNANAATQSEIYPDTNSPLLTKSIQAGDSTWSYYEGKRNGPTLLLVHGFSSNKNVWRKIAKDLSARFHVIIPDLPGWGESTRIAGESYDIDAQATRLNAFMLALDLHDVILVGHSMGGAIVGVHAAEKPDRIARLVLISPLGLSFVENDYVRALNAGNNPFIYDDRAGVERASRLVYLDPPEMSDQQVERAIAINRAQRTFIESTRAQIRPPSQRLALDHRLTQLTMPVLGIGCREDKVVDISVLETLQNGLSSDHVKRAVTLEGCNHLPMIERSVATGQLLTDFATGNGP
ncbi:pimeloyl-ACP methyl ester carboxylesterase [Pseudomonas lini]|uniref:alpha/beta fold hydrolase n=1 Tax=Pseudomonas lini TaxID=163011 RepID=UPI002785B86A|nr:alpha/beta fold hydrolase [Pseudomonas lini]MDQ0124221.1 pimeloyl-ACP methyl ester carboxylesterase [Pseudomonas lini]